jgi:hypothetical protein
VGLRTRHGMTLCVSFLHENHSESTDGARGLTYPPRSKTCLSSLKVLHFAIGATASHVSVIRFLRLSPPRERREERSDEAERGAKAHALLDPALCLGG